MTKHYVLVAIQIAAASATILHQQLGGQVALVAGSLVSLLNGAAMLLTASPVTP
jgi:cytochrome c oxidase assembly factor CtaG